MRASRSRGLSPFRRRVLVALVAAVAGVLVARLAGTLVPDVSASAELGAFLFEVGVQAVVTALTWPYADELIPPPDDMKDD